LCQTGRVRDGTHKCGANSRLPGAVLNEPNESIEIDGRLDGRQRPVEKSRCADAIARQSPRTVKRHATGRR